MYKRNIGTSVCRRCTRRFDYVVGPTSAADINVMLERGIDNDIREQIDDI